MKSEEIINKMLPILSSLAACFLISFLLLTSCVSKSSAPVSSTANNGNTQTTVASSIQPSQQTINPSTTDGWQKMIVNYSYSVLSQDQSATVIEPDPGNSFVLFNLVIANYGYDDIQVDPSYFSLTINQVQYSADDQDVLAYPLTIANLPDGGVSSGQLLFQVPTDVANQPGCLNCGGSQSINVLWVPQWPQSQNLELPRLTLK
jgi:hypothetical protein